MSLINASLLTGATLSASGGTALPLASLGQSGNKVTLVPTADTDFRTRRSFDVTVKSPSPNSAGPNGYTQARPSVVVKQPIVLANGKTTVNTARVELAYDVETSQAQIDALMLLAAQVLFDADFTPTFKALSLA